MFKKITAIAASAALAIALCPATALADLQAGSEGLEAPAAEQSLTTQGSYRSFTFTHSAWLTKGKSATYKNMKKWYGSNARIIHKASIKGNKLYLTGTLSKLKTGTAVKVKNKAFKLTSKTKYYRHVGNNAYYENSSKAKVHKQLAGKFDSGDIAMTVKNGKVTVLTVQTF